MRGVWTKCTPSCFSDHAQGLAKKKKKKKESEGLRPALTECNHFHSYAAINLWATCSTSLCVLIYLKSAKCGQTARLKTCPMKDDLSLQQENKTGGVCQSVHFKQVAVINVWLVKLDWKLRWQWWVAAKKCSHLLPMTECPAIIYLLSQILVVKGQGHKIWLCPCQCNVLKITEGNSIRLFQSQSSSQNIQPQLIFMVCCLLSLLYVSLCSFGWIGNVDAVICFSSWWALWHLNFPVEMNKVLLHSLYSLIGTLLLWTM